MFENINLEYLDSLVSDDSETKKTMLSMLLEEIPDEIDKVNLAFKDNDFVTLKNATHKLKSTLAFVGNDKLAETNKTIEQIAKSQDKIEQLPVLLEQMNAIYPLVLKDVQRACDQMVK